MKKRITIKTPNGDGIIEDIYISELGFLIVRVYYETTNIWLNHNFGVHDPSDNFFTNSITKTKASEN